MELTNNETEKLKFKIMNNSKNVIFNSLSTAIKNRKLKKEIRNKNPNFSRFNLVSHFIYGSIFYTENLYGLKNFNSIKPNFVQINSLIKEYEGTDSKSFNDDSQYLIIIFIIQFSIPL